jgi:hypothetical protein
MMIYNGFAKILDRCAISDASVHGRADVRLWKIIVGESIMIGGRQMLLSIEWVMLDAFCATE